ncbi:hypothetical protein [Streptomyces sioyaensis]|uniref:hypothetical protein n=1 Tax=Streptomyces sioyaensis TaxID=67364 RepID=UPI003717A9A1
MRTAGADLNRQVEDLDESDWDGQAAAGFRAHWQHTKEQIDHALPRSMRWRRSLSRRPTISRTPTSRSSTSWRNSPSPRP